MLDSSLSPCCRYHPAGVSRRLNQVAATHAVFALRMRARTFDFLGFTFYWARTRKGRWAMTTRGTEVEANGGEEVGGLHTSFDVGELAGNSDPAEQRRPV